MSLVGNGEQGQGAVEQGQGAVEQGQGAVEQGQQGQGAVEQGQQQGQGGEDKLFANKYKSTEELEKGYLELDKHHQNKITELNEKLKGFTGSPEEDYTIEDENTIKGFDKSIVDVVGKWGKENGLSQKGYNSLMEEVAKANDDLAQAKMKVELDKLGSNAQERISKAVDTISARFGGNTREVLEQNVQSAEMVELLEKIVSFGDTNFADSGNGNTGSLITQEQLQDAMMKKTESGTLRRSVDKEYAKEVNAMIERFNKQQGI